jgi:hypothetical protein
MNDPALTHRNCRARGKNPRGLNIRFLMTEDLSIRYGLPTLVGRKAAVKAGLEAEHQDLSVFRGELMQDG